MMDFSVLPEWLQCSIKNYMNGRDSTTADCLYCELLYDVNFAAENGFIDKETETLLREQYLGTVK